MDMTKRVMAALMAALVIMVTTYNAYTIPADAASIVVGGVTVSLVDLLVGIMAVGITGYIGSQVDYSMDDLRTDLDAYLDTTEGSSALVDYIDNLPTYTVLGGNAPKPPKIDPDEIKASEATGIYFTAELYQLIEGFYNYIMENDTVTGNIVEDAANQEYYIQYDCLPDNIFIGRYPTSSQYTITYPTGSDVTYHMYDWYDGCITFVPAASSGNIVEVLVSNTAFESFNRNYYYAAHLLDVNDSNFNNFFLALSVIGNNNGSYEFGGGSVYNFDHFFSVVSGPASSSYLTMSVPLSYGYYPAPHLGVNDCSLYIYNSYAHLYTIDGEHAFILPSGQLVVNNLIDSSGHLITDTGALSSAKAIVNKDFMEYIHAINESLAESYPEEIPELSPEAINEIYNNVSNYYDQAVTNYYSNPSYVTENEYVTNITNIYEQAIADNPAVDNPVVDPAIPISPTLGAIGDYKVIGLSDVFPFCIPFDMYDLMTILAAEPKAIAFDCTFYFGEYLGEYTLTVDLSIFDPVAKVVRTMELLLYMYGLMLATRNLIRG